VFSSVRRSRRAILKRQTPASGCGRERVLHHQIHCSLFAAELSLPYPVNQGAVGSGVSLMGTLEQFCCFFADHFPLLSRLDSICVRPAPRLSMLERSGRESWWG